jgi:hypothetical protein
MNEIHHTKMRLIDPDGAVAVAPGQVLTGGDTIDLMATVLGHTASEEAENVLLSVIVSWCAAQNEPKEAFAHLVCGAASGLAYVLALPRGSA